MSRLSKQDLVSNFFNALSEMLRSELPEIHNEADVQTLTEIAKFIRSILCEAISQNQDERLPIFNFTVYAHWDGTSEANFQKTNNQEIDRNWHLNVLTEKIMQAKDEWSELCLEQSPSRITIDPETIKGIREYLKKQKKH